MVVDSDMNFVEPAIAKIVKTLPGLGEAELGELFFLTTDNKLYIRVTTGWLATAALT